MSTTRVVVFAVLLIAGCSDDGGPKPKILSVSPTEICTGCGDSVLAITGTGLSPAVKDALVESPSVMLPGVFLVSPDGVETEVLSDGASLEDADGEQILTVVVPRDLVPPTQEGEVEIAYDVKIKNPRGRSGVLEDGVLVVPPENLGLLGIEPPFGWTETRTSVTITGPGWFASTPTAALRATGNLDAELIALDNPAFIDEGTITAVVPAGLPLGVYDVIVTNPVSEGGFGVLEAGFTVVENPVPAIFAIVPERGTSQADTAVSIFGEHFRSPVAVELIDADGEIAVALEGLTPVSDGQVDTVFPTKTQSSDLPAGVYLVRVTNEDEGSYSTYSAFLVTNPAGNLNPFEETSSMTTGRRMPAGAFAVDTLGNRYVFAIGGDTGQGGEILDTVETSQLSAFGDLGPWRTQASRLVVPRAGAAAVAVPVFDEAVSLYVPVKTFLYVVGGLSGEGEPVSTVERAVLLSAGDAPTIDEISTEAGAGDLEAGTWYYMVSAVLSASDPDNPGGETVASSEVSITLAADGAVTLSWAPVEVNGILATAYRVYRTDERNGVSHAEHLIAEVAGTSYTDDGAAAGDEPPNLQGATGVFTVVGVELSTARWGHRAVLLEDGAGERFIYAAGGKGAFEGEVLATVEWAGIDADGVVGAFSSDATTDMSAPRAFFELVVEHPRNVSTYAGPGARLWAMGGIGADGAPFGGLEASDASDGGGNGAWTVNGKTVQSAAGSMAVIANDKLFCLGGATTADDTVFGSVTANGRDADFDATGDITGSINSTASSLLEPRALGIAVQAAGLIYFIGGTSNGEDAVATAERTF